MNQYVAVVVVRMKWFNVITGLERVGMYNYIAVDYVTMPEKQITAEESCEKSQENYTSEPVDFLILHEMA